MSIFCSEVGASIFGSLPLSLFVGKTVSFPTSSSAGSYSPGMLYVDCRDMERALVLKAGPEGATSLLDDSNEFMFSD